MSQSLSRAARPLIAVVVVMAVFMGVSVASAFAAPEITKVSPNPVASPDTIEVEGTDFGAYSAANVKVGICAANPIEFVPPCGDFSEDVAIDAFGVLTASIEVESAIVVNAHFGVTPKQPETFNCEEEVCGVLAVNHPTGGGQEVLDFKPLGFE